MGTMMKSVLLTVSLLFLLLQEGQTNVKCFICESLPDNKNADCEKGTGSLTSNTCPKETDGCFASVNVEDLSNSTEWRRGCCGDDPPCENKHEHVVDTRMDLISCTTDNCNTMDPRNNSSSLTSPIFGLIM